MRNPRPRGTASLNYFRHALAGYPAQSPPRTHRIVYGPLTVQATSYSLHWRAIQQYEEEMVRPEGQAYALIINQRGQPDEKGGQVVMSLQSFTQLLQWLFAADTNRFIRPMSTAKGTDE